MESPRTVVRSVQNAHVRLARRVLAGRDRARVALEGDRLVDDARAGGLDLEVVLVDAARPERAAELEAAGARVVLVDGGLLGRVSALDTSPGVLAVAAVPAPRDPAELVAAPRALLLVAAGLQDPGNLGAVARSAEAAGASGLAVVAGGARPWSAKALRGSMGSLLRLPVWTFESAGELAGLLDARGFRQVTAATRGGAAPGALEGSGPLAIWLGPETGALPAACDGFERVTIPMRGAVESLNATVAASLLLYAAGRAEDRP